MTQSHGWLMIATGVVASIAICGTAAGQSAAVGTVVLKEDFSVGPDRSNPRAFGPLLLDDIVIEDLPRPEPIDLVIVAGQSNAVGYDANPGQVPADPRDKDVLFWWRCGDPPADDHDSTCGGKWTHLQPQPLGSPKLPKAGRHYGNFAQADGGFGPEIGFARELLAKEPGRKLAIVKAAFSGTGLRTDWNPHDSGEGGSSPPPSSPPRRVALRPSHRVGVRAIGAPGWSGPAVQGRWNFG